ncbi:MAG: hypothetical protein IPK60_03565 [Sandaracinaceae bacterium]|nr:hypothetical protein [Sandaracinaceae bacterium]
MISILRAARGAWFGLSLAALCGCSAAPPLNVLGADAGFRDFGTGDMFAGPSDAGLADARVDAPLDLGPRDAGSLDAGMVDAGLDSGARDAGRDGGIIGRDAGGAPDLGLAPRDMGEPIGVDAGFDSGLGRHGMTFGFTDDVTRPPGTAIMECSGSPATVDTMRAPGCDPYVGDTFCSEAHPILCILVDGAEAPEPGDFVYGGYRGWVRGSLASSSPQVGSTLTSRDAADAICAGEFGPGFRMASFHDGGGWGMVGNDFAVVAGDRQWVVIGDQPANCWN